MVLYANLLLSAAGALGTWTFMVYAGQPDDWSWLLFFLPFAAWAAIPFAVIAFASRRARTIPAALRVLFVATLILTFGSMYLLYTAFVTSPDAQSGIVFVFLPIWQMVGLMPFLLVSRLLRARNARAQQAEVAGR